MFIKAEGARPGADAPSYLHYSIADGNGAKFTLNPRIIEWMY
jgi:hypothetical protein